MDTQGSYKKKNHSNNNHSLLVKNVVEILKKGGFENISANMPEYKKPAVIGKSANGKGYIPDITAKRDVDVLLEIETIDSIGKRYTDVKWKAFDKHARENDMLFYLIVPQGLSSKVNEKTERLKIFPKVMVV